MDDRLIVSDDDVVNDLVENSQFVDIYTKVIALTSSAVAIAAQEYANRYLVQTYGDADTDGLDDMEPTMDSIGQQTPPPPSQPTQFERTSHRRATISGGRAESNRSAKRRGSADKISSPLKMIADTVVELVAHGRQMSRRVTCEEISEAVRNIPNLDPRHRRTAIRKLTKDISEGMAFLSCPTLEEKKQWVEELVDEHVGSDEQSLILQVEH